MSTISVLIDLFITFFKIGVFSFGGGYAMLPLIEREIVDTKHWINPIDFIDIVGISSATPGPIAINAATYVGYKVSGIIGSIVASISVVLFSFLLILVASHFIMKFKESTVLKSILKGLRPALMALILSAVLSAANKVYYFNNPLTFDLKAIFIGALTLFLLLKSKIHPIIVIVISGILGFILYGLI